MIIFLQLKEQLNHLQELLARINNAQYNNPCRFLSDASIGGHSRHVIELLQCVFQGYESASVDYINRHRNLALEQDIHLAMAEIKKLQQQADLSDKSLVVVCEDGTSVQSSFYREIVYNIDHIIHHLALIRVSLFEMEIELADKNMGVAYSTIQYRSSLEKGNP